MFLFLSPLAFFGFPLFLFLFLCLSLSSSFLSFFLLVFPFCFLLVPCFCLFLSFSFFFAFFHERNNIKILNCKFCLHQMFSLFFGFLSFFVSSSFFLSLLFPDFKLCFCSTSRFLISKQTTLTKKTFFLLKRGVATKRFFVINLCFGKCQKLSFFFGHFFGNFWLMFKKHYKHRHFSTFLKAKHWKKWPFLIVTNWATLIVTNWATFVQLKNGQRGPVSNY